jgi:hypothetical protein
MVMFLQEKLGSQGGGVERGCAQGRPGELDAPRECWACCAFASLLMQVLVLVLPWCLSQLQLHV